MSSAPVWQQPIVVRSPVGADLQPLPAYLALLLCVGLFQQDRTFDSIWNTEFGPAQGPWHKLFSTNASATPGSYTVERHAVYAAITASSPGDETSPKTSTFQYYVEDRGPYFGCQGNVPGLPTIRPLLKNDASVPLKSHTFPNVELGAGSNIDYGRLLLTVEDWFADPIYNTFAVTIIHKGKLVLERYAKDKGIDRETPLASNSVCKSFANAFLGLRVADRAIKLTDLVQAPGWDNAEVLRRNMTIMQLSRMVEGFNVSDESPEALSAILSQWSVAAAAAQFPQVFPPGKVWDYFSPDINLLSYNLRLTFQNGPDGDREYWSYLWNRLWKKIGASSVVTNADSAGTLQLTGVCAATALDFARFGQLYLQNGSWDGEQIIMPEWIKYSLTRTPQDTTPFARGDGWWLDPYPGVTPPDHFAAQGVKGQWIGVIPSQQLVITHNGWATFDFSRGQGANYFGNISASFPGAIVK